MKYLFTTLFLACSVIGFSQLDSRATVTTTGLTAVAKIKPDSPVTFPNAGNTVSINLAYSIDAHGETNPAMAPAYTSATCPIAGLVVNTTIPVEIWNDRFVYTFVITGSVGMIPTWAAASENPVLNLLFTSPVSGEFPRLDNLLGQGPSGGGNNGQSYFFFEVNGIQRSDTEVDPFYNGVEGSYPNDDAWVESSTPLPIKLITFKAQQYGDRNAYLTWSTAEETNSSHFNVQRSFNKLNWETIGRVNAAGNSQLILNYEFMDENVYNGIDSRKTVYYRLQMVDLDDWAQFSPMENVIFGSYNVIDISQEILAYPNPASDGLKIEWSSTRDIQPTSLEFYDVSGKLVLVQKVSDNTNQDYVNFQLANVQSGLYLLRIMNGTEAIDHKQIVVSQ